MKLAYAGWLAALLSASLVACTGAEQRSPIGSVDAGGDEGEGEGAAEGEGEGATEGEGEGARGS